MDLQLGVIISFLAFAILALSYFLFQKFRQYQLLNKQFFFLTIHLLKDINKEQALTKQLADLKQTFTQNVLYDPLTGLPSRLVFEDRLQQVLSESRRFKLTFAIIFLNIDEFQIINDALGLEVCDDLLKEVATRLKTSIRQLDTVSRFTDDEFVVILPQLSKAEAAVYVAKRFLDAMSQPFQVKGQELFITSSIGVAVFPSDGEDASTLLKNAANALHQAKQKGKNTYQFYREEMHAASKRELILSSNLRSNAIYNEFTILYQPQINIETKEIFSMDALLHWQHPDFGSIALSEFLRLAENSGKIIEIGEWTLRKIFQDFKQWEEQGLIPLTASLKISLRQLENPHFIYKINQILHETQFEHARLVVEVAEVSLVPNFELIEKALYMLKHVGVQISINEFGSGHLALQHLRRFPFDYLKIDSSLVQDITINKESAAIVKLIINLAQSLQLTVIAEGVEARNQMLLLRELGCSIMQGRLFSGPRRAEEFTHDLALMGPAE